MTTRAPAVLIILIHQHISDTQDFFGSSPDFFGLVEWFFYSCLFFHTMIVIRLCRTWRREGRLTFFNHGSTISINGGYWQSYFLLDQSPIIALPCQPDSLTHSVSDVHETWLMCPWRVKMRELLVNILFRGSLLFLVSDKNKIHVVDDGTKQKSCCWCQNKRVVAEKNGILLLK